jgi:hypothetical protein
VKIDSRAVAEGNAAGGWRAGLEHFENFVFADQFEFVAATRMKILRPTGV